MRRCFGFVGASAMTLSLFTALIAAPPGLGATAVVRDVPEVGTFLHYRADPGEANAVVVAPVTGAAATRVTDTGAVVTAGAGCTSITRTEVVCSGHTSVQLDLGDGDDRATNEACTAGLGCPFFVAIGDEGGDLLIGGGEHDELFGGAGIDVLEGGEGHDLLAGATGADVFLGGDGVDTVTYGGRPSAVVANLDGIANDGETGEGDLIAPDVENLVGGFGNDHLVGNRRANELIGSKGDDVLESFGANDALWGDAAECEYPDHGPRYVGRDILRAGDGSDSVHGCAGHDSIWLDEGNDLGYGEAGNDALVAGPGNDFVLGDSGHDVVRGGVGNDTVDGFSGSDRLLGERGHDRLSGGWGDDRVAGGPGRDRLWGDSEGHDVAGGRDRLESCDGEADRVFGGGGADRARIDARDRAVSVVASICKLR